MIADSKSKHEKILEEKESVDDIIKRNNETLDRIEKLIDELLAQSCAPHGANAHEI